MRIIILPVGRVAADALRFIQDGLKTIIPENEFVTVEKTIELPRSAYSAGRRQYHSTQILSEISRFAQAADVEADLVLGVTDIDLYVPGYNFVFGEAGCPGKVALISLARLRPEFYDEAPNQKLLQERALKEAVHEIGHALGLKHCTNPSCVMFFSLSIKDTDKKGVNFCDDCHVLVHRTMEK